jgi:hypothetical protein
MKEYRKLNTEVQAFVCEFELFDGDDAFEVEVSCEEWNGLSVTARTYDGNQLDEDEVARRFGFRDAIRLGLALTEDVTTDCDYESLRPLVAVEVTG